MDRRHRNQSMFQQQTMQHVCISTSNIATCLCLNRRHCNICVFGQKSLQHVCVCLDRSRCNRSVFGKKSLQLFCFDRSRRNMSVFQHVVIVINHVCVNSTAATTTCPLHKIALITACLLFFGLFPSLFSFFIRQHFLHYACVSATCTNINIAVWLAGLKARSASQLTLVETCLFYFNSSYYNMSVFQKQSLLRSPGAICGREGLAAWLYTQCGLCSARDSRA